MPQKLSDQQLRAEEILRSVSTDNSGKIPSEVINEILSIMSATGKKKTALTKALLSNSAIQAILKVKLMSLPASEWRQKAVISAMLFSRDLAGED